MLSTEDLVDLSEELRRASFHISTQQILAARRVIDELQYVVEEVSIARLRTVLAPIFCTTPDEQRTFEALYQDWREKRFGSPRQFPGRRKLTPLKLAYARHTRQKSVAFASIMLLCCVGSWVLWQEFRARELAGRVVTQGEPIPGAHITLGGQETLTNKDGQFSFSFTAREVPSEISISADGFESQIQTVGEAFRTSRWLLYLLTSDTTDLSLAIGDIELSPRRQQETAQPVIKLREATGSQAARLDPILRLNTADFVAPPPWWQRVVWRNVLLSLLPILIWLSWTIRRWLRRPVLQRLTSETPPVLREVVLHGGTAALLPSVPLRRFAQSLRRRRLISSSVLDETKTIEATAQRGGLFFPLFGSRVEPEYLVLIDRASISDHQAQLALQIVTDLVRSDVLIDHYEFDGDPSSLRHVESGRTVQRGGSGALVTANALQVTTLEELAARTPTHRLLLFCTPSLLFDGLTGLPQTWVEQLATWEERFIFTPEPPERWGRAEWILEKLGFSIIPLSRAGFLILTEAFQSGTLSRLPRPEIVTTTQVVYKRTVGRWLERHAPAPEVEKRLYDDLERTLDPQGFLWLGACAVYPEIHWGLTLRLGTSLFPDRRDVERILPLLVPLVWLRQAFMPDWLRTALLQRLSPDNADQVRRVLMDILSSVAAATNSNFSLPIATDSPLPPAQPSWWARLRRWRVRRKSVATLIREAPQGSPLQDYVFVRFLSGKQLTTLTPTAPRAFLRALFPRRHSWLRWRHWLSFTVCLLLSGGLACSYSPLEAWEDRFTFHPTSFSPDGKTLASALWKFVVLTDVATGKEVARMTHDDWVRAVAVSPNSRYIVSGSDDYTARVWELTSGKEVARMTHDLWVNAVAVSTDGHYVVSGDYKNTVRVWELTTGKEVTRMTHDAPAIAIAVSTDGRYVVSGGFDNTVRVWELTSGKEIARLTHDDLVWAVAVSPNSRYVISGSKDRTVRVSELTSGKEITRMTHDGSVTAVAVSPDGRYVISGSWDKTVRVWELTSGKEVARMTHDDWVTAVAVSPDGQTLASVSSESLQLHRFTPNTSLPRAVAFLVGNNDSGIGAPGKLDGPIPDVRAVGPALESLGFQVFTFENASQQQIRQAFNDLQRQLRPEDHLLVFLSGLGTSEFTKLGERFTFVAATEATAKEANTFVRVEGINDTELATFFNTIPVTQALLVVDASGTQALASMPQQYDTQQKEPRTRFLLASYTKDHPMDSPKGSPFGVAFAAALREMKRNTSGEELVKEITQRMTKAGDAQRPSYEPFLAGGHVSGDFQFVVPEPQRQGTPSSNAPREQQQMAQ